MIRTLIAAFKIALGVLLIPAVYESGTVLWRYVDHAPIFNQGGGYMAGGVMAYFFLHTLIWEPTWFYVLGHELTHAICGVLCFARITGFKVSSEGGSVTLSKSNFFISLGPYLIPFYTLIAVLLFLVIRTTGWAFLFVKQFLSVVGFTWALHLVMTVKFIKMKQPDLVETGQFFSLALITFINIWVLAAILSWAVPGFEFISYAKEAIHSGQGTYEKIFSQLFL